MKELGEFLIKNFPSAQYAAGRSEIAMKCPFCGDSPNPSSRHLYISLKEGQPHFYNCFKCNESGILTSKVLMRMSVYDYDFCMQLDAYNKEISKNSENYKYFVPDKTKSKNLINHISINPISDKKLAYINNRLGSNFTYADLERLRICLNIRDILDNPVNNINTLTRSPELVDQLNTYFAGVFNNNFIILRNLTKSPGIVDKAIDTRYVVYNIYGRSYDSPKRYYIIIDKDRFGNYIYDPIKNTDVYIAEGFFDILSVYLDPLTHSKSNNNVWASINGKSYLNILTYFIGELEMIMARYHLYVDNDVDDWELSNIKNLAKKFNIKVFIHRNVYPGEKDFGVKRNLIDERVENILDL